MEQNQNPYNFKTLLPLDIQMRLKLFRRN